MRDHIDRATERLMARGMTRAEAHAAARREFGNLTIIEDDAREARGARWVDSVVADLRYAARHFARKPLATVTIVLVLALGIGVNSALVSMIQAITLRAAPGMPKDNALVRIRGIEWPSDQARRQPRSFSYPELLDLAARRETFASVIGWATDDVVVEVGARDPETLRAQFVTPNFFTMIGVGTASGAGLPGGQVADVGEPELSVIIGHALWQDLFGGSADAIGTTLRINQIQLRIAGVAPPKFQGPTPAQGNPSLWIPLSARAAILRSTPQSLVSRDSSLLAAVARLAPGVTVEQAISTAVQVAARSASLMTPFGTGVKITADAVPLRGETDLMDQGNSVMVATVFGSVALLILLITCTNVSALLIGAAVARRREIAVRLSLGASRLRIMRQLLTESGLLAMVGGGAGLLLYWWISTLLARQVPNVAIAPDLATVGFTMAFALGTGLLFGLSPALHATRRDVAGTLKDSGSGTTGRSRLQRGFVIAQIVFTQPLLVVLAMMLIASVRGGLEFPDARVGDQVVSVRFSVWWGAGSPDDKIASIRALTERLKTETGILAIVPEPSAFRITHITVLPEDRGNGPRAEEPTRVHVEGTAPGYFAMLEIPILRGREMSAEDTAGAAAAIVIDSELARELWGGVDPVGKRLTSGDTRTTRATDERFVVVGVFDSRFATTRGAEGRVYTAHGKNWRKDSFLIRTAGPAQAAVPTLNKFFRAEAPAIPVTRVETLTSTGRRERKEQLQVSGGAAAAGALALLLASIGLYGVVALAVEQRTKEIGIRVAVGGRPMRVASMFFVSGLWLSVIGLIIGLPVSILAVRLASIQVVGPELDMSLVSAGIAVTVLIVASIATWLPARGAARVDPVIALRAE